MSMTLLLVSYLGGALTILSPCILPVLPFVFARSDHSFVKNGLPLLLGMTLTFAAVATLATLGGAWAVHANRYGRLGAMLVLATFGVWLLLPSAATRATQPLVALGNRFGHHASSGIGGSVLLGAATGLLWAPCAGPILGLVLTGAAIRGASADTAFLLLAYAAGASTSLAAAVLVGGRVLATMKRSLGVGEWIRRALGAAVLAGVAAIALGLDTGLLTRISTANTAPIEQSLIGRVPPPTATRVQPAGSPLPPDGVLASLAHATGWLNSPPLTPAALHGRVVLVDFWTYSCINCLRELPYLEAWAAKYREDGLVVIGVHSPEFAFECDPANVRRAVRNLGVTYPVALDSHLTIWKAVHNEFWPALYFIDAQGRVRAHHFGEGAYAESEHIVQTLLKEAGYGHVPGGIVQPDAPSRLAPPDMRDRDSPETYVGYERGANFKCDHLTRDAPSDYSAPATLPLNG
jgi:cytochrome c biogenesis protein CcdA/thiol-disulfide isomerase/thioredoxin